MIRHIEYFDPLDRLVVLKVLAKFGEMNRVLVCSCASFDLAMTVHADIGARHRGMTALFNLSMAVLAVDLHFACVKLMAERDRLLRGMTRSRRPALADKEKHFAQYKERRNSQ